MPVMSGTSFPWIILRFLWAGKFLQALLATHRVAVCADVLSWQGYHGPLHGIKAEDLRSMRLEEKTVVYF